MRLGDAHGKICEPLARVSRHLLFRLLAPFDAIRPVNLTGHSLDLLLDACLQRVQELEFGFWLCARLRDRLCELRSACAAKRPVVGHARSISTRGETVLLQLSQLLLRVCGKLVDGHHDMHAKLFEVLDVVPKVGAPRVQEVEVFGLVLVGERRSCCDGGATAVHLQGAHSSDNDGAVGGEAGVTALDVKKTSLHRCPRQTPPPSAQSRPRPPGAAQSDRR
mmetsp:Transcript_165/g.341  ORF Transcript_165/g.341 Transcript_165/m.341 type:complete len:221 (+) Transcript_165:263-925(+)